MNWEKITKQVTFYDIQYCQFEKDFLSSFSLKNSEAQLELCAVTKCVGHDDIFIEVVGVRITVSLDLVNNLVDRDN